MRSRNDQKLTSAKNYEHPFRYCYFFFRLRIRGLAEVDDAQVEMYVNVLHRKYFRKKQTNREFITEDIRNKVNESFENGQRNSSLFDEAYEFSTKFLTPYYTEFLKSDYGPSSDIFTNHVQSLENEDRIDNTNSTKSNTETLESSKDSDKTFDDVSKNCQFTGSDPDIVPINFEEIRINNVEWPSDDRLPEEVHTLQKNPGPIENAETKEHNLKIYNQLRYSFT